MSYLGMLYIVLLFIRAPIVTSRCHHLRHVGITVWWRWPHSNITVVFVLKVPLNTQQTQTNTWKGVYGEAQIFHP